MLDKVHPYEALDDFEVLDEPNFNNFNTSPEPPSPYADLEKKYRKNRFNKNRNKKTTELYGVTGVGVPASSKNTDGNKLQKRKPKKKNFSKVPRSASGKRNA
ncbi:MAG: hypothetical protein FDX30_01340 [Chlorobium sp.]|nr:MAG: hypothetical protein FDX30_01340 [Chlorobium sp.]